MEKFFETFSDPAEVEHHYRERNIEIKVTPLERGHFCYRKHTASPAGFFLRSSQMETPWSMEVGNESDSFLLVIPVTGRADWMLNTRESAPSSPYVLDYLSVKSARFAPMTRIDTIVLPAEILHRDLAALTGQHCYKRLSFDPTASFSERDEKVILQIYVALKCLLASNHDAGVSPIAVGYLRQALVSMVLERGRHNFRETIDGVRDDSLPSRLRRAVDFMQAHAHEPISLAQIAAEAALSIRGLQSAFSRWKSISPMSYLKSVRLERLRSDLCDPSIQATCAQIIYKWGFSDVRRFSKAYRQTFGETPSETYAKARGTRG
ncbi:helix-turn-helix transcriptional regulator [Paraburkholderia caledonica]